MTRSRRTAASIVPKTVLEKKLYVFHQKWLAWFDAEQRARGKTFSEDDYGSDEWKKWSQEYRSGHPRPKIPKALLLDFNERHLGSALGQRLRTGYYRCPKVAVVSGEYGTNTWLIKKHADFGPVAVDIVRKWENSFQAYSSDHTDRPPEIAQEIFDALPNEYGEKAAEEYRQSVERWVANERSIAECEEINALIAKAKEGDQIAAVKLIDQHMQGGTFCGDTEPKIDVFNFENVEPS